MNIVQTIRSYLLFLLYSFQIKTPGNLWFFMENEAKKGNEMASMKNSKIWDVETSQGVDLSRSVYSDKKETQKFMTGGAIIKQSHACLAYNVVCIILPCSLRWCTLDTYIYLLRSIFFGRNFWGFSSRIFSNFNLKDL